ncbi:universal stress protein [Streptomyces sp. NPDC058122]|uniref:universal stress protein n=1 Tax=Streptomyces sp. NPDC058122 TaxID=3346349 RepID=UPI0036E7564B
MFHRILIAVDGTAASHNAVETTAELASLTGATVRVLHIDTSDVVYDAVVPLEDDRTAHGTLYGAMSALRQAGVQADGELLDGLVSDVAPAVEEAARRFRADLIVVSPHHRGRLASWFTPSVSGAIVRSNETPVLLAPASN